MSFTKTKEKEKEVETKSLLPFASAFWFVYAMIFLFVITILYIIFGQILKVYLYPTTLQLTGGVTTEPDKWLSFWGFTPYIIILVIGLFLFFKLTQKDTSEGQL